jgi:hypothetical protein
VFSLPRGCAGLFSWGEVERGVHIGKMHRVCDAHLFLFSVSCRQLCNQLEERNDVVVFNVVWHREAFQRLGV